MLFFIKAIGFPIAFFVVPIYTETDFHHSSYFRKFLLLTGICIPMDHPCDAPFSYEFLCDFFQHLLLEHKGRIWYNVYIIIKLI